MPRDDWQSILSEKTFVIAIGEQYFEYDYVKVFVVLLNKKKYVYVYREPNDNLRNWPCNIEIYYKWNFHTDIGEVRGSDQAHLCILLLNNHDSQIQFDFANCFTWGRWLALVILTSLAFVTEKGSTSTNFICLDSILTINDSNTLIF